MLSDCKVKRGPGRNNVGLSLVYDKVTCGLLTSGHYAYIEYGTASTLYASRVCAVLMFRRVDSCNKSVHS